MSVDLSGEITAIATAVLAVFAVVTALFAFLAWRGQSGQLKLLKKQVTDQGEVNIEQLKVLKLQAPDLQESIDERKRDREQRHRDQASRVLFWEDRAHEHVSAERGFSASITAYATNTSDLPVYGLEIRWHRGTAPWGGPDYLPDLMPGDTKEFSRTFPPDLPDSVDRSLFGAVLRFRDAAGARWLRGADGQLDEEPETG